MKSKILWIGAVVLSFLLTPVWAADIFGRWIARTWMPMTLKNAFVSGPGADRQRMMYLGETIFSFRAEGTNLVGMVSDSEGETPIREGKIKGDTISFVLIRNIGGNETKLVYRGKVYLNEIRFTCKVQGGMKQLQEFVAKREFQRNNGYVPLRNVAPVQPPLDPGERKIRMPDK